ncbi:MAG: heme-binding domain-containing protein [Bacteroidota bacterium]
MRRVLIITFIILCVVFVIIQFFQPEKNKSTDVSNHIFTSEQVPDNIASMFKNACLDCHSNNTKYLWYHNLSPVSWMVNKHVIAGKDELNLSEWGKMDIYDKISTLEEICQETKRKTMPLKSYSSMHKEAKLTDEQIAELCSWSTKLSEQLLTEAAEN